MIKPDYYITSKPKAKDEAEQGTIAARAEGCPCIPYPPVPKDFLPQVRLFPSAFPLPLLVGLPWSSPQWISKS